ncbi:MAG: hypothetical protein KJ558_07115 [Gammaproteobacteria bacterium]|nr:hypothetical protein [Gammaproteobacteria bacterium]MBU1654586.1 hypothetical protein [Gammaproteobacteria bacterium]MBU1961978.1 hypothetical protein [Gammaproteobacteria bacterium]
MNDDDAQTLPQTLPPESARRTARSLNACGAHWVEAEDLAQAYALHLLELAAGRHSPGPVDPDEWLAFTFRCIARKSRAGIDIDDPECPIEIPDRTNDPLLVLMGIEALRERDKTLRARAGTAEGYLAEVTSGCGDVASQAGVILALTGSRAATGRSGIRRAQQFVRGIVERANGPQPDLFDFAA